MISYKGETDNDYYHTDVYKNGECIGYLVKNNNPWSGIYEQWQFKGEGVIGYRSFSARTRKELKIKIEKL